MKKVITFSGSAEHGKTSVAEILKKLLEEDGERCLIVNFADYLKYIASKYLGWDGNKDEQGRKILQVLGTDIVRAKNPDFWVETVMRLMDVFWDEYDYFLIPDCRFPNELKCFEEADIPATSIKVIRNNFENRLTPEQRLHPSEIALDGYSFDYTISSESGLDNLEKEVIKFYNILKEA